MATISAVLYANTQHPELKQIYPNWNDRCKQILKRWRSLSTEKKAPFLQHAKDNRSALRMRRSQQDQERICLNQKTLKEQEQERIWKQHQAKAKEAQTSAYTNRGMTYDVNIGPERGTVDKQSALYNNDITPEAPAQSFVAEEICSANLRTIPVQESPILIEQLNVSENNDNPPDNKQLRTLLLTQQRLASSWVSDSVTIRSNLSQQPYEFKSGMQQNAQKASLYKCTDNKAQITTSTLKNGAMLQTLETIQQEPLVTEIKPNLKSRRDLKITDNGDTDMEKLDPDENVGFGDILGGLGDGNDDDLLKSLTAEIGDDFNILEYADPELDELASSQNLLNKLDFDYNDRNS